jgi:transcriptional regulator with XRE-family HTH domain
MPAKFRIQQPESSMSFRSLREQKLLSQEKLSQMSGLSLRTIQRLEAGHRVSYASLRSLAATLQMDVDELERELYAMKKSEDYVEVPRWVRQLSSGMFWRGAPQASRRQALTAEAVCMGIGIAMLIISFVSASPFAATLFRLGAAFNLLAGYAVSVGVRVIDSYQAWPASETPWSEWQHRRAARTWKSAIFDYSFVAGFLLVFFGILYLLTR